MKNLTTYHDTSNQEQMRKALKLRGILVNDKEDRVERVAPGSELVTTNTKYMTDLVAGQLQDRLNSCKLRDEQLTSLLAPSRDALKKDKEGAMKVANLRKAQAAAEPRLKHRQIVSEDSTTMRRLIPKTFMTLQPGVNVLTPPWNRSFFLPDPTNFPFDFAAGGNFSDTGSVVFTRDSYNGEIVGDGGSGFAAAGFFVQITSPSDRIASIRPFMPYTYDWNDDSTWGYTAHSSGGLGIIVTEAGVTSIDNRPQLWNDGTSWSHDGDSQNGYLLDHLEGGEFTIAMRGGQTSELLFFIWAHADCAGEVFDIFGAAAGSVSAFNMTANLDFIVIA
jgi:hypothetical protein